MVDVLLIGSGGREHALAWKLKQSPRIGKLYIAPGNGGTRQCGENVPIGVMEFDKLAAFAEEKNIGLTVCSMDDPLVAGVVDFFQSRGLRIWGPNKAAAQLEGSKAFSKQLMAEAGVPTAEFGVFTEYEKALEYVQARGAPIVVKASGLALGKGVVVAQTLDEAEHFLRAVMVDRIFKDSGNEVVIEEFLEGPEISIHALSDGESYKLFPASQDHKRALDNDAGKNTGGMGVIAPLPFVSPELMREIDETIVRPTLDALKRKGIEYKGILYPGLILTTKGPKVLEYNARFGDPECQVYMRLLKTDLLDLLEATVEGTLATVPIEWNGGAACNVVVASGGYPENYRKGLPILGIEAAETGGVVVFHAGTSYDGELKTSGGRVLGVSATASDLKDALAKAYAAIGKIHFEGMQYRRDIGRKAVL